MAYWDIAEASVVQCQQCRQMQLDPMFTGEQIVAGCVASHAHEKHKLPPQWFIKNNKRHFRSGVRFAAYLQSKGIRPRRIMELGPGEGYFSRALAIMFPGVEVVCLDADEQVGVELKRDHGFDTHIGLAEDSNALPDSSFDLIVARDFLEHVMDPAQVIRNCHRWLKNGGHLYILTPNGYQDVWHIHLRWLLHSESTDLFGNHLNYFDGAALVEYMNQSGLTPVDCRLEGAKTLRRGSGWSFYPKHAGAPPKRLPHRDYFFESENELSVSVDDVLPSPIWREHPLFRKLLSLRYTIGHLPKLKFSIDRQVGHYISCLNQKRDVGNLP